MKKRIDTLTYDTETAKKLGEYFHGYDDAAYTETLYKKRTGEYFIYGEGGPASKWSASAEDGTVMVGSSDIKPLSYEEARKWFEKANNDNNVYATDETYNREFGKPKKDEPKEATTINLSRTAKRKLEQMAIKQGIPQNEVIENLILSD